MACNLQKDASGTFDAISALGTVATVFVQSTAAPTARISAATINGATIPVNATSTVTLPALQPGTNVLALTVVGATSGADVQLTEDCGDGSTRVVKTKFAGAAPGGADPVVGFRIHAS